MLSFLNLKTCFYIICLFIVQFFIYFEILYFSGKNLSNNFIETMSLLGGLIETNTMDMKEFIKETLKLNTRFVLADTSTYTNIVKSCFSTKIPMKFAILTWISHFNKLTNLLNAMQPIGDYDLYIVHILRLFIKINIFQLEKFNIYIDSAKNSKSISIPQFWDNIFLILNNLTISNTSIWDIMNKNNTWAAFYTGNKYSSNDIWMSQRWDKFNTKDLKDKSVTVIVKPSNSHTNNNNTSNFNKHKNSKKPYFNSNNKITKTPWMRDTANTICKFLSLPNVEISNICPFNALSKKPCTYGSDCKKDHVCLFGCPNISHKLWKCPGFIANRAAYDKFAPILKYRL